jgi:3-methyladenine DNA glycosylase AlkD
MAPEDQCSAVLQELKGLADQSAVLGMARYGINPHNTLGISIPHIRSIAREIGRDHILAARLWGSGIHEARILAALVDDPKVVTREQMERWVIDFDSWDVCDQVCGNLFDRTLFAYDKVSEWSGREEQFVKRAGFVLMAGLSVHDRKADEKRFLDFLPIIVRESCDDRNFVKKAVSWALRQIGKRNSRLNEAAVQAARQIQSLDSRSARWIARDAIRELTSERVLAKLRG